MDLYRRWYATLIANWQEALRDENFKRYFPPNFIVCVIVYYMVMYWLNVNSTRPGLIINDPIYHLLEPRDLSWFIFFFTYTSTTVIILYIVQYPYLLHRALMSFVAVFVIRAICIRLVPLSPSPGIIPLYDPVTDTLGHEGRIMNDLFFSGHVSDIATFYFLCRSTTIIRRYMFLCMIVVGSLLVWQRVHYTIDVVMAPVFSYVCYWIFVEKDFIWKPFLRKPQFGNRQDHFSAG
jgi:hypothetical protein